MFSGEIWIGSSALGDDCVSERELGLNVNRLS